MLSKAERVRAAIASCGICFEAAGKDMWAPTERVEELWMDIEGVIDVMAAAEAIGDGHAVRQQMTKILSLVSKLEVELTERAA